jgi:prepilin-type N-terminal cleavage/methylation domain-containing protein
VARRSGFTLIETLMVIVVVSLTGLITYPKFADAVSQNTLHGTRAKVIGAYSAARAASTTSGRATYLHVHGNQLYVTAIPRRKAGVGDQDTIGQVENLYTRYGVQVLYSTNADSIRIDRNGVGGSAAATIRLLKGSRVDTVIISQYGRVTK